MIAMPNNLTSRQIVSAESVLPGTNLSETVRFFIEVLDFRVDSITPADNPEVIQLSGHGLNLLLDVSYQGNPGTLRLLTGTKSPLEALIAPNGTRVEFTPAVQPTVMSDAELRPSIQRFSEMSDTWKIGRAGMQYRDLIPDHQDGRLIASHIRIPKGGPVADNVHYHNIQFQIIYCYRGWVRLVYEDQGEPFVARAGDCVLQPPHIRHRVLENSDNFEVIEISSPARHVTCLDHAMQLPTGRHLPERDYDGQTYVFHQADKAHWEEIPGFGLEARDLGIAVATDGLIAAHVLRRTVASNAECELIARHKNGVFIVVLQGYVTLFGGEYSDIDLIPGSAFIIPAGMQQGIKAKSHDVELLKVRLPANYIL